VGFDPAAVTAPALFLHGDRDRVVPSSHSEWLSRHCPAAELRLCPGEGHISVLNYATGAMEWLRVRMP
jgi:pimeloyl-ACP methyl ester carboxylesterase